MGSCGSRDPPTPVEKAKTLTAAFGRGDKGPFLDALADDCVLEAAPRPKVEGKAAITEMFGRVPPSMKAEASNHTESGPDQVTYDEMWFDVTIPGMIKPVGTGMTATISFKDGKIASIASAPKSTVSVVMTFKDGQWTPGGATAA